ncbi:MAG: PDZ domain-containing protein [Planctomycetota bacterium]
MLHLHRVLLLALGALLAGWLPGSDARAQDFDTQLRTAREHLRGEIHRATAETADRLASRFAGAGNEHGGPASAQPGPAQPAQPQQPGPTAGPQPWIGLIARAASPKELEDAHVEFGLTVTRVVRRGPASRARIRGNDVIVRFAGQEMHTRDNLRDALRASKIGDRVVVVFRRNGIEMRTEVEVTEKPAPPPDLTGQPATMGGWLGLVVSATSDGLMVMGVMEESPAAEAGIKPGDIVVAVDGHDVKQSSDLQALFAAKKIGDSMAFAVRHGNEQQAVTVVITQKPAIEYDLTPPARPDMRLPELPGPDGRMSEETSRRINEMNNQGVELLREKKYEEAIERFEAMLQVVPDSMYALYNLACAYSLLNQREKAVEYYERSLYAGFVDWDHIAGDTDLNNIRDHPKYIELWSKKDHFARVMAEKQLENLKSFLTDHEIDSSRYVYKIDEEHKFVFAAVYSEEVLSVVAKDLMDYAEAQWEHLFIRRPQSYITILLTGEGDFRKLVPNRMIGGFYNPQTRTLLMPSMDSTLTHEFTHALHFADTAQIPGGIQAHSIWFVEGLATCFEYSRLREHVRADGTKGLIPELLENDRLQHLQERLASGTVFKLAELMRMSQREFMNGDPGLGYAESCFLCRYIHGLGKLKEFYATYCDMFERDNSGIQALEKVIGKPLRDIEKDFFEWAKHLPPYHGATGKDGAFLGANMDEAEDGVRLTQVVDNAPAAKSGLQVNDVIMVMDGVRVVSTARVLGILGSKRPGDTVLLQIKRGGKLMDLTITLGKRE